MARVCADHDLPRSSFYRRAKREGWLRSDETRETAARLAPPPPPAPPTHELAQQALDRAAEAVLNGDLRAAEGWARMVMRLRALAVQEAQRTPWRYTAEQHAAARAETTPTVDTAPDETDCPAQIDAPTRCEVSDSAPPLDSPASLARPASSNPYSHRPIDDITQRLAEIMAGSRLPDPEDEDDATGWAEWEDP